MNKKTEKKFTIVHLYPEEMNIYGDLGNILTLKARLEQRGFLVEVKKIGLGAKNSAEFSHGDIYFMGGGQDDDMYKVFDDLVMNKKEFIEKEIASNKVFFLICGAFQLFGEYFLDSDGRQMKGLGILPITTKAPSDQIKDRCVGNIISQLDDLVLEEMESFKIPLHSKFLVGFENHSGQTFITQNKKGEIKPMGKVIYGKGNNAVEKIEGARLHNIFGSYLHGSVLPKNPHFTDLLLNLSLKTQQGKAFQPLSELDDEIEWLAHKRVVERILS